MPPEIDPAKVEQVKTLATMGKNDSQISRMTGLSRRTVVRYRDMEDPPELFVELSEMRKGQVKRFGEAAWPFVHGLIASLKQDLEAGTMKPRDKIITVGILVDKINTFDQYGKGQNRGGNTTVRIELYDESKAGIIANPTSVPRGEFPIQGDDMRPGSGQDILRLPGGSEDGLPVSEIVGGDSSLDISEPGGLRTSDDSGRTLGEPRDAGGLGRELHDEQTIDGGDL